MDGPHPQRSLEHRGDEPREILRSWLLPRTPDRDRLRLLTKVARLYHEKGIRQPEIAAQLSLSQARVSRLLKEAVERGIVQDGGDPSARCALPTSRTC